MQRDWDTVRYLLLKLEAMQEGTNGYLSLEQLATDSTEHVSYHIELLLEAGLIKGHMHKRLGLGPHDFICHRLTWYGHEFLDAIRNEQIWHETKQRFQREQLTMTVEGIQATAVSLTTRLLMYGLLTA